MARKLLRRFRVVPGRGLTDRFPNGALSPSEATPRIRPESAARIACDVDELRRLGVGDFEATPAIVIAIWQGPLVKYLVDEDQAQETIRRLTEALRKAVAEETT